MGYSSQMAMRSLALFEKVGILASERLELLFPALLLALRVNWDKSSCPVMPLFHHLKSCEMDTAPLESIQRSDVLESGSIANIERI